MKSIKFAFLGLAAGVATACAADTVTTPATFGLLPVSSAAKQTILSVPWCACSASANQAIVVSNIVKTANLTAGDKLYLYDTDKFMCWELTAGAGGVKYWNAVTTVTDSGKYKAAADGKTVARGGALILIRENPQLDGSGNPLPFYLYGQLGSGAVETAVAAGTSAAPAYTLLAPPTGAAKAVNSITFTGTINPGDRIQIPRGSKQPISLRYDSATGQWGTDSVNLDTLVKTFTAYEGSIPVGTGCWYVSAGGSPTVTW